MKYLAIRNFDKYQHYKDRRPPWVKLHAAVLDDYDFMQMPDQSKAHLMLLWILASQCENKIPHDLVWITRKIGAQSPVDVDELILRGFLEPYAEKTARGKLQDWPSRYVSAQTRAEVLSRCDDRCVACGATEKLEIDHIIPISLGGSGDPDNLQVLCRSCNRAKRQRIAKGEATHLRSSALRTIPDQRSSETETETETEKKNPPADAGDSTGVASPATPRPAFSLAPYLDAHRERFPDSDPPAKRYGAVFKRLEGKHGAEETLRRWRICLTRKGTFATPEELSAHWSEYAVEAIRAGPAIDPNLPLVDEWGQLTEYGERVTRPDRLKANPYA